MKKFLLFIQNNPEARTQAMIVMGFIILPIVSLCIAFYIIVLNDSNPNESGQRLKVPQEVIDSSRD